MVSLREILTLSGIAQQDAKVHQSKTLAFMGYSTCLESTNTTLMVVVSGLDDPSRGEHACFKKPGQYHEDTALIVFPPCMPGRGIRRFKLRGRSGRREHIRHREEQRVKE